MFDTLVESSAGKKSHRSGKFAAATTIIYVVLLTVGAIWSIMKFNASLAETADAATLLAPPPPPPPPPPPAAVVVQRTVEVATSFTPPKDPPKEIPKAVDVKPKPVQAAAVVSQGVPGGTGVPGGVPGGVPSAGGDEAPPPPPPPPPPKPSATPPPPKPSTQRVSGGVLQGSAIRKVQPPYPAIAKAARAQGAVQVAVTISEEGRVISAEAVSGHPLLRQAAIDAAKQWTFRPTELSGVPVKVQGILTFNFNLQ